MPRKLKAKDHPESDIRRTLSRKKTLADLSTDNFKVSFQYLDTSQRNGSGFRDWQSCGLLSHMLEIFQGLSSRPLTEQFNNEKLTKYGGFPSPENTNFKEPTFVPEDANWARIHVNGKSVVIGHVVNETFYVVFLDKYHNFWLSKKK